MVYKNVIKPILFRFSPETVHDSFITFGELLGRSTLARSLIGLIYEYKGTNTKVCVDGLSYKTPIILAAGFDCNGKLTQILPRLSFGGVEIGSVTARPCAGNPSPRLTRLPSSQSILVNKGLKNDGVDAIIKRLKSRKQEIGFVIGISIARTNDKLSSSLEAGIEDYVYSFQRLNEENVGDYYTLNISCPNAFGGETFATPELLEKLLMELKKIPCKKPVYVKLPINLEWEKIDKLIEVITRFGLNGVVVGNLNKNYRDLDCSDEVPKEFKGGVSGKPCAKLSNSLIKNIKDKYGDKLTIIGCGGILSPEDAMEKIELGSNLLSLITGLIYSGPSLPKKICESYSHLITTRI